MVGLAWLMSSHRRLPSWRIVIGGLLLQFAFALLILRTPYGQTFFDGVGEFFYGMQDFIDEGSDFLFNFRATATPLTAEGGPAGEGVPHAYQMLGSFAFRVLPTIIFYSALMSILYYLGVMQLVVQFFAWIMRYTLGTSGAESLSAAANIFVGQTEAPLVIRPFVPQMTLSELNAVMVGGFATVAGGVLAAYVSFGINAGHLLTASVISAPAALVIAKVMLPEVDTPKTFGTIRISVESKRVNVIEAAAAGTSDGLKLALNVGAMLIAFTALVAMADFAVGWVGTQFGFEGGQLWSLSRLLGYLFAPLAWVMGIEWRDCLLAGELLGKKTVLNEFIAFQQLSAWLKPDSEVVLQERSIMILTYALCGFANFSSIGIQLGGIGGMAPERRGDLARLGVRAMIGGTLAAFMTACVAGILL